jgi:hypothetical protein
MLYWIQAQMYFSLVGTLFKLHAVRTYGYGNLTPLLLYLDNCSMTVLKFTLQPL